jgi:large subunit ribosomal protein L20
MRVKTGFTRRHKHQKVLKAAKGFWMTRSKRYKAAHEAVMHSGDYAFNGRRLRRRDMRKLWIVRLNAAIREMGSTYSKFIAIAKTKKVELNRKTLSEIAVNDMSTFKQIFSFIIK